MLWSRGKLIRKMVRPGPHRCNGAGERAPVRLGSRGHHTVRGLHLVHRYDRKTSGVRRPQLTHQRRHTRCDVREQNQRSLTTRKPQQYLLGDKMCNALRRDALIGLRQDIHRDMYEELVHAAKEYSNLLPHLCKKQEDLRGTIRVHATEGSSGLYSHKDEAKLAVRTM